MLTFALYVLFCFCFYTQHLFIFPAHSFFSHSIHHYRGPKSLLSELEDFLGFNEHHDAVVIGTGSLGTALMQDHGLVNYGLNIVAGFDIRSEVIGQRIGGVPIYEIGQLAAWQRDNGVSIAILTVPVERAQETADLAIASGMTALWNFTPIRIKAPEDVVITNTSIYAHLAIIYNRMHNTNSETQQ